ncbi:DHA2 family efflux MFS transporter permease subunit [Streptomyces sp. PT12]|uniref:DHA2 family efflux MFS transporter permease subunit n=1 Tax=Streptomyces sp. PT12 TaxID=1510197 RepID=UPI000DE2D285|nr:DHA2 family efflux MFS transporter permease subunit [Streptomyces sp. PT12]RBM20677.1 MFS transporter [Streptomyces sp. PT12]
MPSTSSQPAGIQGPKQDAAPATKPVWLVVLACSLPMFMVALDNLVVSTALRTLAVELQADTQDLQWFVNAYVLSFACLLLTGAALGDRFGRRRVFTLGIAAFTLASVYCGMADTSGELILGRVFQGFGAAAVMPLSLTLLSHGIPDRLRGLALGLWSAISGAAIAMGPVVGGAVVEGIAWQWIFWINVPVGLVAIPLAVVTLRESSTPSTPLDLPGMVLATGGVLALVWGIVNGETEGWTSPEVLLSFAGAVVLLAAFVQWQRRAPAPLLPLSFYHSRSFTLSNLVSGTMYFGVFGSIFLLAQYLQVAPERTALQAGVLTLTWTLVPMFIAPIAGALTDRVGGGRLMALGLLLQGVGLSWINLVSGIDTPYAQLAAPMVIAGAGMGLVFAPTAAVVLGSVSRDHAGKASGANITVREIGGAVGIAVLSSIFVAQGSDLNAQEFVNGMQPAIWTGVAVTLAGAVLALGIPRKPVVADSREKKEDQPAPRGPEAAAAPETPKAVA